MELSSTLLYILFLLRNAYTFALTGNNVCPRYARRMKPNNESYQVFENICCPNYKEVDNKCIACPPGLFGQNCSFECIENNYGPQCRHVCKCQKYQICNKQIGCTCEAGFTGDKCDTVCASGFYGLNCIERCLCSVNSACNSADGKCKCNDGWMGQRCDELKCAEDRFGKDCNTKCTCSGNRKCHHVTGECSCFPGRTGLDCNEICKPGTYGVNCTERCRCSQCDPVTGDCFETESEPAQSGVYVGAVLGGVALLAFGLILIFAIARHQKKIHGNKDDCSEEDNSHHYDDIDYCEIGDVQRVHQQGYSYAYSDEMKPPVKARKPATKRNTNQYLSFRDSERVSKLPTETGRYVSHFGTDLADSFIKIMNNFKYGNNPELNRMSANMALTNSATQEDPDCIGLGHGNIINTTDSERVKSTLSVSGYLKPVTSTKKTADTMVNHKAEESHDNTIKEIDHSRRGGIFKERNGVLLDTFDNHDQSDTKLKCDAK